MTIDTGFSSAAGVIVITPSVIRWRVVAGSQDKLYFGARTRPFSHRSDVPSANLLILDSPSPERPLAPSWRATAICCWNLFTTFHASPPSPSLPPFCSPYPSRGHGESCNNRRRVAIANAAESASKVARPPLRGRGHRTEDMEEHHATDISCRDPDKTFINRYSRAVFTALRGAPAVRPFISSLPPQSRRYFRSLLILSRSFLSR